MVLLACGHATGRAAGDGVSAAGADAAVVLPMMLVDLVVFVLGMLLVLQYVAVVVVLNAQANASLVLRRGTRASRSW